MGSSKNVVNIFSFFGVTILVSVFVWFWWPWAPDEFLGEADFEGHKVLANGPISTGGLQATYNGILTFSNIDRSVVSALLPSNFELAPRKTAKYPNLHPVVLMFGDQTDAALVLSQVDTQPNGVHYSEMILAIPFVQRQGKTGAWHTYIVRMYLDNAAAVAGGLAFGYKKVLTSIEWQGKQARIWQPIGGDLLTANFVWGAHWYDGSAAFTNLTNFRDMVSIMTTEILGHNGLLPLCSHFEWNFDNARVATVSTTYTMNRPFRNDMSAWPGLSPWVNVADGAVVVRGMRWRLKGLPQACSF